MRICIFTDTLGDLNGVSRFIQDMGEQALSTGFDLHIVTSTAKHCPDMPNVHNLAPRWRIPMPFYRELDLAFPSAKALEHKLLELAPDMVHISTPGPVGFTVQKLAKKHGIPMLSTYHTDFPAYIKKQTGSETAKKITDAVMARFYKPFKLVFTRSHAYLQIMRDDIRIESGRSVFLSPGTNRGRFHPIHANRAVFTRFGIPEEGLKVLYVGRISKEKNIPFLLDVWSRFKTRHPEDETKLILVGEGALRHRSEYVLTEDVHFTGPIVGEDLSRLYASSDLFIFPSVTDTLGQVVMEAQASGVCALVSDEGGPKSIVEHKGNPGGLVVRGNDTEAWIDALENVLNNATLRHHLGRQGLANMKDFDIGDSFKHFSETHMDLYARNRG